MLTALAYIGAVLTVGALALVFIAGVLVSARRG